MKRFFRRLFPRGVAILLCLSLACPALAVGTPLTPEAAGAILREQGIYQGDGSGDLMLDKGLTRAELAAILTRIHGEGTVDPNLYTWACYFTDVPEWAKPYVGYCTANLLVKGYGDQRYGAGDPVTPAAACTMVLRLYEYADGEGSAWTYDTACTYAVGLGLIGEAAVQGATINRGDMAVLICNAAQKRDEPSTQLPPTQQEGITYSPDGTITGKVITQADWSREDFSQTANPEIFTGCYSRGWYNAIRQSIVDRETILAGNDVDNFNPSYLYAHTLAPSQPAEYFDAFSSVLGHISSLYNYYLGAEPYTKNQYEFPGYTIIKVHEIAPAKEVLPLIQPKLASLEGKTDREKVLAFNDYLCDLLDYGKDNEGSLQDIFSTHTAPVYGVCADYSSAFSFLCSAAGIPCIIASSDTGNHSWNEVYVEGQWLTVDVTYNDAISGRNYYLLSTDAAFSDTMPQACQFAKELLVPGSTIK